ncbi:MAG: glycoside hydrolase family 65 protein, partial [Candidatus Omnitrophica bacterium]|nr:glycoside hydrolase family 65 protein [Candidatus Omnitrophota bacterium]
ENYMPVISKQLASRDYSKTQLIKQADVLMALYILSDAFTFKTKSNNYHFYIDRTMHKSSLSAPMNALMAIEVGDRSRAYGLFNTTLRTDISNIYNNTYEGMHGASLGGAWQLVINGFVGLRIQRKILSIRPRLPRMWRKVLFCINWRGRFLRIEVENARVKIQMLAPRKKRKVRLKVFGLPCEIKGSKVFKFERKKSKVKFKEYYL